MKPFTVAVFCGSSDGADPAYIQAAEDLGYLLGCAKINVIYGGGRAGLMGKLAASARGANAHLEGFVVSTPLETDAMFADLTIHRFFPSIAARKEAMIAGAQACVVLPGGLGTLDETFELLFLKQLKIAKKPIVFVNTLHYWDLLLGFFFHLAQEGFIASQDLNLFHVVNTPQEAIDLLVRDAKE